MKLLLSLFSVLTLAVPAAAQSTSKYVFNQGTWAEYAVFNFDQSVTFVQPRIWVQGIQYAIDSESAPQVVCQIFGLKKDNGSDLPTVISTDLPRIKILNLQSPSGIERTKSPIVVQALTCRN